MKDKWFSKQLSQIQSETSASLDERALKYYHDGKPIKVGDKVVYAKFITVDETTKEENIEIRVLNYEDFILPNSYSPTQSKGILPVFTEVKKSAKIKIKPPNTLISLAKPPKKLKKY